MGFDFVDFDFGYLGSFGTVVAPANKIVEPIAFGFNVYTAIWLIPRKAANAKLVG